MLQLIQVVYLFLIIHQSTAFKLEEHLNWNLLDHENCGESLSDRIIGGSEATLGQYPWMVRIGYIKTIMESTESDEPKFSCGGSLINNMYIVTAAHCCTNLAANKLAILRLGEHNADSDIDCEDAVCAPPVQDFRPAQIVVHPDYNTSTMWNDIALIRLDQPANISDYVSPICILHGPLRRKSVIGSKMEVAGWGLDNVAKRHTSSTLLQVRVPVLDPHSCLNKFGRKVRITSHQLCAGGQVGKDSCGGDSGGPLMKPEALDGPPKYFLFGVVSYGSAKCGSKSPAIYTDVRKYTKWILDNIFP